MTTLAQMIVEDAIPDKAWGHRGLIALSLLRSRLGGTLPNDKLMQINGEWRPGLAEQFVFSEDAPEVVKQLIDGGSIDSLTVFQTARVPTEICWLEWKAVIEGTAMRLGVLFDGTIEPVDGSKETNFPLPTLQPTDDIKQNLCIIAAAIERKPSSCTPIFLASVDRNFTITPDGLNLLTNLHWSIAESRDEGSGAGEFKTFMRQAMFCLFLIVTPRVCEVREVLQPAKLQAARLRRGKLPLLEYKHMVLKVGVGTPRYRGHAGGETSDHAEGRRLHSVIGHFRTLREGRERPHVSWVPEHWRGRAELGIVMHVRDVKRDANQPKRETAP